MGESSAHEAVGTANRKPNPFQNRRDDARMEAQIVTDIGYGFDPERLAMRQFLEALITQPG
jgi:hypothetical protein